MPGLGRLPDPRAVRSALRAPVWVDNDVNVLALGEWRSGVAAGHDNVVVVKIGTGIGAGIISDGRLHRGAQGSAGDVGHIQVADDPSVIVSLRQRRLPRGDGRWRGARAVGGRRGDRGAQPEAADRARPAWVGHGRGRRPRRVLRRPGRRRAAPGGGPPGRLDARQRRQLLQPIAGSSSAGASPTARDLLLAAIRETVYRRSLPLATRDLLIQRSSLGGLAGVIGASAMVVDQLFSRDALAAGSRRAIHPA